MLIFLINIKNKKNKFKGKELKEEKFLSEGAPFHSTIIRLLELGLISTTFLFIEDWGKYPHEESGSVLPKIAKYSFT